MFDSIKSLYAHVEKQAFSYKYMAEIGELFQKLRDQFRNDGNDTDALQMQYEVDAFNLMIKDGHMVAQFIGNNEKGEEVRIPDITKFTDVELDYFVKRLENTKNSRLEARYAHILWESPKKKQQYATAAVKAYLEQIPSYENLNILKQNDSLTSHMYHLDILECVNTAFYLTVNSKLDVSKIAAVVWRLIHDSDSENMPRFTFVSDLMTLVLDNGKHFKSFDLTSISDICLQTANSLERKGDLHSAISMNELGKRVNNVLQSKTTDWNNRIAICYEKLMARRKKSPMVAAEWCQRAIDFFKVAGNKAKVEELTPIREQLGSEMEFQVISTKIDQTAHIKWCEKVGQKISNKSTKQILEVIASDPGLLPLRSDMELYAKESGKKTPLLSLISETIMDDKMHVVEHVETPEEKLERGIIGAFKFHIELEKLPLINAVIYHSFRAGKLDAEKVINSLAEFSWIGSTLNRRRGSNKEYNYCWLDQLSPAIKAYFSYVNDLLDDNEPNDPPIMAIDSLTTKFEGMIRDYAQLNGIITSYDTKDKKSRTVTREKSLSTLLNDPKIAELFNQDDLLLFRFMFIEHSGFTFRHRVAHGLMLIEDYNFGNLQFLFVALMRLAKYILKSKMSD